ncbi:MAG: long-chain fatty acid--CoA ligase [Thermoleophilia bacterium]
MDWNLASTVAHQAERGGDRLAIEAPDATVTYAELHDRVERLAAGLAGIGIAPGQVVALLGLNSEAYVEAALAVGRLGGVALPLNWRLAPPELAYILEHSETRLLLADDELRDLAERSIAELGRALPLGRLHGDGAGGLSVAGLREEAAGAAPPHVAGPDELARLMYTSGTTGHPKGVMITHANILWKNVSHARELGLGPLDVGLVVGPLYHVGGLDLTTTTSLYLGASIVVHRRFEAPAALAALATGRFTNVWLAPAMLNALLVESEASGVRAKDLRLIIGGGEKTPLALLDRIQGVFPGVWFCDAYGLTETVSGDTFLPQAHAREKPGSVGLPVMLLDVAILDEDDRPVPAGTPGEICLRGPKVCAGYWKRPEDTERAFRNGWFHTGDVGVLDGDGYLTITDRLKDMIISGGENIASAEVERVLYEHPAVREAAVVGRPDERWGEVPVAFVALRDGVPAEPAEIVGYCAERLARFKTPKDVLLVPELPRNPSGKVLKRELRERLQAG